MSNEKIKGLFAVLTVAVIVSSLVALSGWVRVKADVTGGGDITNQAPTVPGFTGNDPGTWTNNTAHTETYTGTVKDTNGEIDIKWVNFTSVGLGGSASYNNDTSSVEYTSEPGSGPGIDADGITVWNTTAGDGILSFKARRTFAQYITGATYTQYLNVTDGASATASASETTVISVYTHVTFVVVNRDNTTADPATWAFSNATQTIVPTSANINSTNWLRAYNDGTGPATVGIQFGNFTNTTGVAGGVGTINLTTGSNMKFRYNATPESMNDTVSTAFGSAVNGAISGVALATGTYLFFEYQIIDVSSIDILYVGTYTGTVTTSYSAA